MDARRPPPVGGGLLLGDVRAEYDQAFARRVVEDHLAGRRDATQRVWSLLAFELWR